MSGGFCAGHCSSGHSAKSMNEYWESLPFGAEEARGSGQRELQIERLRQARACVLGSGKHSLGLSSGVSARQKLPPLKGMSQ